MQSDGMDLGYSLDSRKPYNWHSAYLKLGPGRLYLTLVPSNREMRIIYCSIAMILLPVITVTLTYRPTFRRYGLCRRLYYGLYSIVILSHLFRQ
jgi:hypothetical protein